MAHMRKKLIVKEERIGSRIRVLYRDRKQERAFAILKEIRKIFPLYRSKAVERNELPPLVPESAEEGNGSSQVNPGTPPSTPPSHSLVEELHAESDEQGGGIPNATVRKNIWP